MNNEKLSLEEFIERINNMDTLHLDGRDMGVIYKANVLKLLSRVKLSGLEIKKEGEE